jgi:predicted nucleic acid-binding protein
VALIVVDASVLIAFLDADDAHHPQAVAVFSLGDTVVLPASAYAEVLIGPLRRARTAAAIVDEAIGDLAIRIEPVTREIARRAAGLRASHPALRLPDALVLATGDILDASAVVTADRAWPRISRRARVL